MQRYAVLADIHANAWALEAVLADAAGRGLTGILALGDILYGPLAPRRTYDLLCDLPDAIPLHAVSGNQDRLMVEGVRGGRVTNPTLAFVLQDVGIPAVGWLDGLPRTLPLEPGIFLCHGTPEDDAVYLLEDVSTGHPQVRGEPELRRLLAGRREQVVCCGHSHLPRLVALADGRLLLNPGSVGLQAYRDETPNPHAIETCAPHASYALLEEQDGVWRAEFVRLPYDWQAASQAAAERGRDDWAYALATGRA